MNNFKKVNQAKAKQAALIPTRLENYKKQHRDLATQKGLLDKFLAAPTLTQARRILFNR